MSDGSGGGAGTYTAESYCRAYQAIIVAQVRCVGYSQAAVAAQIAPECQAFVASVAAGRVRFDATKAAACLAGLPATVTCAGETQAPLPAVCAEAASPLVVEGGACGASGSVPSRDCAGPTYCRGVPPTWLDPKSLCVSPMGTCTAFLARGATCALTSLDGQSGCGPSNVCSGIDGCIEVPPPRVLPAIGQPCASPFSCAVGAYCDDANTCQRLKVAGDACGHNYECGVMMACQGTAGATTCVLKGQVGDPCTPGGGTCAQGSYCGADARCTITGVPPREPCGFVVSGEPVFCDAGGYCIKDNQGRGTCSAKKTPGSRCYSVDECSGGLGAVCDTKTNQCVVCSASGSP